MAVAFAAGAGRAGAHAERYPKRDAITVTPSEIRMEVDYAVPRGELAGALRRIFDRDRSGSLDDAERAALSRHLAREATAFLRVSLDGKPLALAVRAVVVDASGGADDRLSARIDLAAGAALGRGDHTVRVADRHKDRRLTVPLAVTLAGGLAYRVRPPVLVTVDETHAAELELRR